MKLIEYLGKNLKSDEMLELLESNALEVVFETDRLREGAPDSYHISDKSAGFQMLLDEDQIVRTVFCYVTAQEEFSAIDPEVIGVPLLASIPEVDATSASMDCEFSSNEGVELFGRVLSWAKLTFGERAWHYEYEGNVLRKITLMENWESP